MMSGQGRGNAGRLSYWLVPAEPDKTRFAQIISGLAQRFAAPAFEPHVTLYSGPHDAGDNPEDIIRWAAAGLPEMVLRSTGIGGSAEFTKTLFVEFETNEALRTLSDRLKERSARAEGYMLRPHLSLIYASLEARAKQELAAAISVPTEVRFDVVKAIVSRERTASGEDVRAWRVVAERRMAVH